jgi:hypothetical protein
MTPQDVFHSVSLIRALADLPELTDRQTGLRDKAAMLNHTISTGTCLYYSNQGRHFIATNRHVLTEPAPWGPHKIPPRKSSSA